MQSLPEEEIIARAAAGHTAAFRVLVERYQPFAFSLAFRLTGHTGDAEDMVQEAFVRLWKNLARYRPGIKLTTWLYTIVTNCCLDLLKSKRYRQQRRHVREEDGHGLPDASSPEKEMQQRELMQVIRHMAETLTPKQRAVFVLRDLEGLPVQQVCEALFMSAGHVKSNLYHARLKMSKMLTAYYQEKND